MKRTKDLAEEAQEKTSVESTKHLEPTKQPKIVRMVAINLDLHLQLLKFLGKSPGATNLVVSLSQADLIDVTLSN